MRESLPNPLFSTATSALGFTLIEKEQHEITPDFKVLDTLERVRYQRYLNPQKQLEFLTGRTFLKNVLAKYLDVLPQSISLSLTANGKPYLAKSAGINVPFFNLSHAAGHYLIGLSRYPIGVDIEPYRWVELMRFRHFLSQGEYQQLTELPEIEQSKMFFKLFTAKEAFLKATDKAYPLDAIQFQLNNQEWQLTCPESSFQFTQTNYEGCCITVCTNM
ncbi:4'-phosphopantetheinyl transferase superfamily protein [Spirosoma sp. BT702]|uniref:4'-phosphopantetheinyl transferase superfamily protein n=1 Tax=Spirosoma profusum TaxID=2771354 RepID=A0A927AVA2_9BACT|nr:4'-phosphopantetheinyl transferase superfamily protein [Spirosoma profusum]MBD2705059.1 4'-phosphopantetheinyl transferase superfamily protein [Spirosoma profusum]